MKGDWRLAAGGWLTLCAFTAVLAGRAVARDSDFLATVDLGFSFTNIAAKAGLSARTIYGKQGTNTYLLETTGTGIAAFDYDGDGWLDIFQVNGTTLEGFPKGQEPTNHLYRNQHDGTFEDVTARAGLAASGWGQGVCTGDYDNDGHDDLFITYWGQNKLYRNRGDGAFDDVTVATGLTYPTARWSTSCAFLDYDRDGRLDLVVANYIDLDLATTPLPSSGLCRYKGLAVACGPPGLPGARNFLYHNKGDGTFEDVSQKSGIAGTKSTYALGVSTLDFDGDGWIDVYVANDSNPSTLYRNNHDGTFTDIGITAGCALSQDGRSQSGMGIAIGDYDRNGTMDIFKTNFAGDTSTLYANSGQGSCEDRTFASGVGVNTRWLGWGVGFIDLDNDGRSQSGMGIAIGDYDRNGTMDIFKTNFAGDTSTLYANSGQGSCEDRTFASGVGVNTRWLGWGVGFIDLDNDGWPDLFLVNGHVYPEVDSLKSEAGYKQPKVVYRNLRNGRFADVTAQLGSPVTIEKASRGAAFADFDNDGDVDVVVNNIDDVPDLFRLDQTVKHHWITLRLIGTTSNRSAIGALVRVVTTDGEQRQEVRGGGSYYSQSDLRLQFGLGDAKAIDRVIVRWPNGSEETWTALPLDRLHTLTEGRAVH